MRKVTLIRHGAHAEIGAVLSGRSEIPLSDRGTAEAAALAEALDGDAVASLHSSPRRRATETAAPLAAQRELIVQITPSLDEIDFGAFTGRTFASLDQDPDWYLWNAERGAARCPSGETMAEAVARVFAYLEALAADQFPAVCVSHCDIIRGVVAHVLGLDFARMFAFDCDLASRTIIDLSAGNLRLVALNQPVRM